MVLQKNHVDMVCRLGQDKKTCSFLMMGDDGFECAKASPFEKAILELRAEGTMHAKGNNCSGPPDFALVQ